METVCQACGYQRKPTDQAPDWECPSCGRAYVKTSHEETAHESPSPLVFHTDNPAAESGNRLHAGPSYRKEPKGTPFGKREIFIGMLFALFLILGIPILADPSAAPDILLHSNVGLVTLLVALIFIALMSAVGVMRGMSAGGDSGKHKSLSALVIPFIGLVFAVFFFGFAISVHNEVRTETKIQQHGLRTMANVVRIYTGSCGRGSCSTFVEYVFTPSAEANVAAKPVHGYADLGDHAHITYARTKKQVPIAYEVGHPEVSALNFNDDVFRPDHGKRRRGRLATLGKLFLGIFVLVLAVVGLSLWLRPGKKLNTD